MKTDDQLKVLIDEAYEHIPIPEGLEDRLSAAIDAAANKPRRVWLYVTSIAAALALVITLGLWLPSKDNHIDSLADTYTPEQLDEAYLEAERVLLYVSQKMNGGMEQAGQITQKTVAIPVAVVNKMINTK